MCKSTREQHLSWPVWEAAMHDGAAASQTEREAIRITVRALYPRWWGAPAVGLASGLKQHKLHKETFEQIPIRSKIEKFLNF